MDENQLLPDRRQFLIGATASALWTAFHTHLAWASPEGSAAPGGSGKEARILDLRLLSATPLAEMREFYEGAFGFPVLEKTSREITFGAGETRLTFVQAEGEPTNPFYHVAFNIPENKLLAARDWQLERTPLLPASRKDKGFPDDVTHFPHWNAHSLFFWDPAGNLLEHIARHDLKNGAPGPFTSKDLLYASEIGLIVDDVLPTAEALKKTFGLEQYRQGSDQFRAIGDERGLLLVMKRGRNLNGKSADIFPTRAEIQGESPARYDFPGYPLEVTVSA